MLSFAGAYRRCLMIDALRNRAEGISVVIYNDHPDYDASLVRVHYEAWSQAAPGLAVDAEYRGDDLDQALLHACIGEGIDPIPGADVPDVDAILEQRDRLRAVSRPNTGRRQANVPARPVGTARAAHQNQRKEP